MHEIKNYKCNLLNCKNKWFSCTLKAAACIWLMFLIAMFLLLSQVFGYKTEATNTEAGYQIEVKLKVSVVSSQCREIKLYSMC